MLSWQTSLQFSRMFISEMLSGTSLSNTYFLQNNYVELEEGIAEICHLGTDEVMTVGETLRRYARGNLI